MSRRRRLVLALSLLCAFALAALDGAAAGRTARPPIPSDPPGAGIWGFVGWSLHASTLWNPQDSSWNHGGFYVAGFFGATNRLLTIDATAIRIWDTDTAQVTETIAADAPALGWPTLSADGRRLATGGPGAWYVLDATTGEAFAEFPARVAGPSGLALSANGTTLVTRPGTGVVSVWDVDTGRLRRTLQSRYGPGCVGISPDGRVVAAPGGGPYQWRPPNPPPGDVQTWDVASGEKLRVYTGHTGAVRAIRFTPDGRRMVTGSNDGAAKLWDVATGDVIREFVGHRKAVRCVEFDENERFLVTGSDDSHAILWDMATGSEIRRFSHVHGTSVLTVNLSPDGSRLVTSTTGLTQLWVWDVATGSPAPFPRASGNLLTVHVNADGTRALALSQDGRAALWDTADGSHIADIGAPESSGGAQVRFGCDGDALAIVQRFGSSVVILDADTGETRRRFDVGDARPLHPTFTADLRLLAVRALGKVALWDTTRGELVATYSGAGEPVTGHVLSPGGGAVAVGTLDGVVRVWNVGDNRPPWALRANATLYGGYTHLSDDGAILITQNAGEIVVWDVPTGEIATAVPTGRHFGSEYPRGRILASADGAYWVALSARGDGYLWSAKRPRALQRVSTPQDAPAAITRDGRLVTGFDPAGDDVQPLLARGSFSGRAAVSGRAVSDDGSTLVRVLSVRGLDVWRRARRQP